VRVGQRIGIDRVPRDVSPTLGDLMRLDIEERRQEEAARAAGANVADGEEAAGDETFTSGPLCGPEEHPASEEADDNGEEAVR
jgi:hypothetical protein